MAKNPRPGSMYPLSKYEIHKAGGLRQPFVYLCALCGLMFSIDYELINADFMNFGTFVGINFY